MAPYGLCMPAAQVSLDGVEFGPQLSHDFLLRRCVMLGLELHEGGVEGVFDLPLDGGHKRRGQQIGIVIGHSRTEEDLLNIAGQASANHLDHITSEVIVENVFHLCASYVLKRWQN